MLIFFSDTAFPRKFMWIQNQISTLILVCVIQIKAIKCLATFFICYYFSDNIFLFSSSYMTVNVAYGTKNTLTLFEGCFWKFILHAGFLENGVAKKRINLNVLTILFIGECITLHNSQPLSQLPSLRPEHHHYPTIDEPLPPSKL